MIRNKRVHDIERSGATCVSHNSAVTKLYIACLLVLFSCSPVFPQVKTHRCEVSMDDWTVETGTTLGRFSTVIESDKPNTKAFPLPGTKLIVTASVLYMQESPYLKGSPPSEIILMVVLGTKAYPDTGEGLRSTEVITNARAKLPLKSFERARVETIFLGKREPIIITLECNK